MSEKIKATMTISELAIYFRVSERTIQRWCQKDKIPYMKIGREYRFDFEDVKASLNDDSSDIEDAEDLFR